MDLALLRTFLAVHRAGSFTRAAALLGLSQPAVTGQIRSLERQVGRPLFLRGARGVTPTGVGDELAHKVAPHLDALQEIARGDLDPAAPTRALHLTGPPEFTSLRAMPALVPLVRQGLAIRAAFCSSEESLQGLADGRHDLAILPSRPRGPLLTATPLCDEEKVLVAAEHWADRTGGPDAVRARGPAALEGVPVVCVHEGLPLLTRYWSTVFEEPPPRRSGVIVVPDLRAVLECVAAGAGMAVLPRYVCREALDRGRVVALFDPLVPPLRTYFLAVRPGSLAQPHIARAHEWLLRAAADW
ncbi:LysR family transcriptional regulator [Streptomyces sp. TRM43335]|uniref:LysR family transcriptional regulator n=1 Tax=Streptomyces taklimakanensis TaxID=2569853 RepID=A0A6G2BD95_9ACTN|nr:LysR family transcriptional regulator [Streptomyces taklimakanensis]MTE20033.1 LysR family transcriptional regulator [Streptomyces taklimakanensis]